MVVGSGRSWPTLRLTLCSAAADRDQVAGVVGDSVAEAQAAEDLADLVAAEILVVEVREEVGKELVIRRQFEFQTSVSSHLWRLKYATPEEESWERQR